MAPPCSLHPHHPDNIRDTSRFSLSLSSSSSSLSSSRTVPRSLVYIFPPPLLSSSLLLLSSSSSAACMMIAAAGSGGGGTSKNGSASPKPLPKRAVPPPVGGGLGGDQSRCWRSQRAAAASPQPNVCHRLVPPALVAAPVIVDCSRSHCRRARACPLRPACLRAPQGGGVSSSICLYNSENQKDRFPK